MKRDYKQNPTDKGLGLGSQAPQLAEKLAGWKQRDNWQFKNIKVWSDAWWGQFTVVTMDDWVCRSLQARRGIFGVGEQSDAAKGGAVIPGVTSHTLLSPEPPNPLQD